MNATEPFILEEQPKPEELDEATHAALGEGEASIERGEIITLAQSNINLEKRIKAWRKLQQGLVPS